MRFLIPFGVSAVATIPGWFLVAHATPFVVDAIFLDAQFPRSNQGSARVQVSAEKQNEGNCSNSGCLTQIKPSQQFDSNHHHQYSGLPSPSGYSSGSAPVVIHLSSGFWDRIVAHSLDQFNASAKPLPIPVSAEPSAESSAEPASVPVSEASVSEASVSGASVSGASVDSTYSLGTGDQLQITIFNVPEYSGSQQVLSDGSLNLPVVGKLPVVGLTLEEAEVAIANHYQSELRYPRVTVSLLKPRPLQIAISGEVNQPGSYILEIPDNGSLFPTVVQAIQSAGGMTQAADLRQVQVRRLQRDATQIITVNLWELLQNGDIRQNLALRDGDAISIPPVAAVNLAESAQLAASNLVGEPAVLDVGVVGEVFRPGIYTLSSAGSNTGDSSQGRPTVSKVIQQAGGIKPSADIRQIQVRRPTRNGAEQIINIDFWQLFRVGDLTQDLVLQQGDTVSVPTAQSLTDAEAAQIVSTNLSPDEILVNVVGEVKNPGTVRVPANTTLNQALLAAGGFTERSRKLVELIRLNPDGTILQRQIQMDFSQGANAQTNPLLWNNDVIVVDRTSAARLGDRLEVILGPLLQLLPVRALF